MNLIIDIGNSATKIAVFDGGKLIESFKTNQFRCEQIEKKYAGMTFKRAIISSVRDLPSFIYDLLTVNIPFIHILSFRSELPFSVEYETPETLGTDRIAAVAGAYASFPGSDILVIDAGTAITYDFLNGETYRGGNISPGLNMRFRALHRLTGRLPLGKITDQFRSPAKNSMEAVTAGVITGVIYEINEYIRTFENKQKSLKVILTGGDSEYLKGRIAHEFTYMPDIVTEGLNYILDYNAK